MNDQWLRKIEVILYTAKDKPKNTSSYNTNPDNTNLPDTSKPILTFSDFRIRFYVRNADQETPDNCEIRIYNLKRETIEQMIGGYSSDTKTYKRGEFTDVALNAGYQNGNYGNVFRGSIRQYRVGRENNLDSYIDILASDGAYLYNITVDTSVEGRKTIGDLLNKIAESVNQEVELGSFKSDGLHTVIPRGVVLFGMVRAKYRNIAATVNASWTIQDRKIVFIDTLGYTDADIININATTGLIGVPEQTQEGIRLKCLLNSEIKIGNRVRLNNKEITQFMEANPDSGAALIYNKIAGLYNNPPIDADGLYRAFVVEHEGDTRGQNWYTHLVCLSMDETTMKTTDLGNNNG
jgi:hypothetical protein